jgi:hypothetical protein
MSFHRVVLDACQSIISGFEWQALMTTGSDELTTFDAVVDALGGMTALARLTGRSRTAVSNWRCQRHCFPARTYFVITTELERRGFSADRSLWQFESPEARAKGRRRHVRRKINAPRTQE